jgi:hypothetical protein
MMQIWRKLPVHILNKKRQFFAIFFGENISKIITPFPGHPADNEALNVSKFSQQLRLRCLHHDCPRPAAVRASSTSGLPPATAFRAAGGGSRDFRGPETSKKAHEKWSARIHHPT